MKRCSRPFPALLVLLCVLLAAACASAAEILPMDLPAPDLNNGEYCVLISDEDQIEDSGYFTAELFLEDRYGGDQIRALAKGDERLPVDRGRDRPSPDRRGRIADDL